MKRRERIVSLFSGVVTLDPEGGARVPLDLPIFDGRLRLTAVAWSTDRLGAEARSMTVRDPVVLTPSLPRFLAAGDRSRATVQVQDERDHLTQLAFSGGRLWVPQVDMPIGTLVRLRIMARDVSLALQPVSGSSILNSFPVTVTDLTEDGPAQVMVRLGAGEETLLTRVTRRSQRALNIERGSTLYAQVKSVALLS